MKKIFFLFLVILLLSFNSSILFALFAGAELETAPFFGYLSGPSIKVNDTHMLGLDVCFCVCEDKSPKLKLKSVKQKLGWRMSLFEVKRKNDELKNSKIKYNSTKFMMSSEYVINEKFSFNIKGLYGLGVYTHNECTKSKEEYVATSVIAEGEIFAGAMFFLTKRLGVGVDLGYRGSTDINENRENAEKFDPSGLITMLTFTSKLL